MLRGDDAPLCHLLWICTNRPSLFGMFCIRHWPGQHRLQDHPRPCETGEKNYALDSHALNGYPCLNLCVHTSHTCENTSEWLEVGEEGLETCAGLPDRASA